LEIWAEGGASVGVEAAPSECREAPPARRTRSCADKERGRGCHLPAAGTRGLPGPRAVSSN